MIKKLLLTSIFISGCSSLQQSSRNYVQTQNSRNSSIDSQVRQLQIEQERNQDLRDRQLFLSKKKSDSFGGFSVIPQKGGKIETKIASSESGMMSEGGLYAEIVDFYQMNNLIQFNSRASIFFNRYSQSVHRDDVLYMKGMLELLDQNYGLALVQFNKIIKEHPHGKKVSAALYAKGMTYKKMNLKNEARGALRAVLKKYPGSPESYRAKNDLQLLK